jgi:hypothetical protein
MLAKWQEGYQVVYAQRHKRRGESLSNVFLPFAFIESSIPSPILKFLQIRAILD